MKSFVSLGSCKVGLFDNLTNAKSHARKKPSLDHWVSFSKSGLLPKKIPALSYSVGGLWIHFSGRKFCKIIPSLI